MDISLNFPVGVLPILAPRVSASLQLGINYVYWQFFFNFFQSGMFPIRLGISKAFVLLEIFFQSYQYQFEVFQFHNQLILGLNYTKLLMKPQFKI